MSTFGKILAEYQHDSLVRPGGLSGYSERWGTQTNVEYAMKIIDGLGGTDSAMPVDR